MQRWHHLTWKCTVGLIAAVLLLIATFIGLFRLLAPLAPGYREQVQAGASQALGRPVRIAAVGAQWGLDGPEVTLENVEILSDDSQRVVIAAHEIRLGYTLGAMLHGRFSRPNRIILIQPQLGLDRDANGIISIRGLESTSVPTDWRQEAGEIFAQNADVLVRGGEITLIDKRSSTSPLVFSNIRLNVENTADSHKVSGRLLLPPVLGRSLSFAGDIQGQATRPEIWQWQVDVQGSALNVPQWLAYWPTFNKHFSNGQLDLSADMSGLGASINRLQADVHAEHLIPADNRTSQQGFDLLSGIVNWSRSASGWILAGSNMQVQRNQESWPASNLNLQFNQGTDGSASWSGDASFLRLQDVVTLAAWLPTDIFPDRQRLLRLAPSGDLRDVNFRARWNGKSIDNWSLAGSFNDLGLLADGKMPGFSGLSGQLSANQDKGELHLTGEHVTANFPQLFRSPLTATTLGAHVQFHHDAQGWHISTEDFSAANTDLQVQAKGTFLLPADGSSPVVDLQANAQNVNAKSKSMYLPVGIMPKEVVSWLDSAIVSGQVPSGSLILRGRLQDFPYDNGQGLFDIRFHLINGVLDYAAGWPRVQSLEADVEFKNQGMSVAVQHGTYLGDDISGATANFADLRQGILIIKGTARGSAAAALTFLRSDALRQHFGHSLDSLTADGRSDVSLNLVLPVEHLDTYKLECIAHLQDVSVALANQPKLTLSRLNGDVRVTRAGVSSDKLNGVLLGEPVTINLRPDTKQDVTLLEVEGGENVSFLTGVIPEPFQKALSGSTTWQLSGDVPNNPGTSSKNLSLTLNSDLSGLGVDLPAPLGKSAEIAIPLRAGMSYSTDQGMLLQFRYGDKLNGVSLFKDENASWRFDRGELVFGTGQSSLPANDGLVVTGSLPEFSLDAWKSYSAQTVPASAQSLPGLLRSVDVEFGKFSGFGQAITNLHVQLARDPSVWNLTLTSDAVAGKITVPFEVNNAHPITADMQRVTWIHKTTNPENNPTPPTLKPSDVPPLQITVKQLRINDLDLENVKAQLERQSDGTKLKAFSITNPAFSLTSSGSWTLQADGKQQSTLDVQMKSSDVEKTLQSFGYAPGIDAEHGELQTSLSWPGSPFDNIPPILNGKLHIQLKDGRLLEVQPGAGRLFGLLSINALPRRLLLNFGDVFGKGFAFDSIGGDFLIQNGDAYTKNMLVSGPAAKIHMVGRIGLAKHDFDEALIVDTSVGASLPVLGAIAAGSLGVGAVIYALTEIFKKPLTAAGEIRYRLTGTWDNPVLTKAGETKPAANSQH
ncbi:MAG: YhdP family protein [Gammaproteobacteria bacterium]